MLCFSSSLCLRVQKYFHKVIIFFLFLTENRFIFKKSVFSLLTNNTIFKRLMASHFSILPKIISQRGLNTRLTCSLIGGLLRPIYYCIQKYHNVYCKKPFGKWLSGNRSKLNFVRRMKIKGHKIDRLEISC